MNHSPASPCPSSTWLPAPAGVAGALPASPVSPALRAPKTTLEKAESRAQWQAWGDGVGPFPVWQQIGGRAPASPSPVSAEVQPWRYFKQADGTRFHITKRPVEKPSGRHTDIAEVSIEREDMAIMIVDALNAHAALRTFVERLTDGGHGASAQTAKCAAEVLAGLSAAGA